MTVRRRRFLAAALAAAAGMEPSLCSATAAAGRRSALVVGNSRYPSGTLKNAVADARLLESVLSDLGFQTTLLLDASLARMLDVFRSWTLVSSSAATRVFFYAGHGAQYRGRNFLVPVDAELRSEDDLPGRTVDASDVADRMSRFREGVNVLVFDACRSLPLVEPPPGARQRGTLGPRPAPGLAALQAPKGTLIAYSTAPGALAADDPVNANSPYTRHLAAQLKVPGLSIENVFKRARAGVLQETGGTQVPWETSSLVGDVCLAGGEASCGAGAAAGPRSLQR